jgi:hypothetical protein
MGVSRHLFVPVAPSPVQELPGSFGLVEGGLSGQLNTLKTDKKVLPQPGTELVLFACPGPRMVGVPTEPSLRD